MSPSPSSQSLPCSAWMACQRWITSSLAAASGRAAADDALDAPLRHKVDGPVAGRHHRLPPLHLVLGARHQSNFLQVVAPIRHIGRNVVVLAVMRKTAPVESLPDDFHLLLKQFPVGVLVHNGGAENFNLAGMVAPAHAEAHPPVGEPSRRWRSPRPVAPGSTSG